MTRLLADQIDTEPRRRPTIITLAIAAAILVGAALKYAPSPIAVGPPPSASQPPRQATVEDVLKMLGDHNAVSDKNSAAILDAFRKLQATSERQCIIQATSAGIRPETCIP